jgi:DNA invertase Pin-like site-specific DNA recombinase
MEKAVPYYRVSTKKQLLGLDAQKHFVDRFMQMSDMIVIKTYYEKESGKSDRRPELKKAIRYCKKEGAVLIFSTMSRLSRSALLVADLMIKKVNFRAADKPNATFLEHLEDAIRAEREVQDISRRTKDALAAAKANGVQLGKHGKVLALQNKQLANAFAQRYGPMIEALRAQGYSFKRIAKKWNVEGISSFRQGHWHASTVYSTWKRYKALHTLLFALQDHQ